MYAQVFRRLACLIIFLSLQAHALEIDFVGRTPDISRKLRVLEGVNPGIPVIFEESSPGWLTLRPAKTSEHSNAVRAVYKFERQEDKTALFYELYDPALLKQLHLKNALDTAQGKGKEFEKAVVQVFLGNGEPLRKCLPASNHFLGSIVIYIQIGASGNQEKVLVSPEGAIAQCLIRETLTRTYASPKHPFVAKISLNIEK